MDLRQSLEEIAGPATAPTDRQVVADMDRGRKALRRRRALQAAGSSAFAVAAIVAAVSFTATTTTGPAGVVAAPSTATATASAKTKLVAYTGEQPKGFTVDVVPEGWYIQASDEFSLLVAPKSPAAEPTQLNPDGSVFKPSVSPYDDPDSFVGKIAVMLQSKDQQAPSGGEEVRVGDRRGMLLNATGSEEPNLWIEQDNGVWVLVQFWDGIGLSEQEKITFGAGIHVEKGAQQGVG